MATTVRNPACPQLRRLISPYDHGVKFRGRVVHANRNERVVCELNSRGWVHGMTAAAMRQHFTGELTVYYTADGRIKTPETLVMVDVDCHRTGTYEAAVAFAEHLRDHHFTDLYFEPSTNGNGVHAYLLLDKRGFGDVRTHSLFGMLDRAMKGIHADWQARNPDQVIEMVEVKGHPPRIDWNDDGKVTGYTSGQLAKLPREVDRRGDEFRATTRIDDRRVSDLYRRWKVDRVAPRKEAKVEIPAAKPRSGSISGHVVGRDALDGFDDYLGLAGQLLPGPLRTSGREVATVEDLAILLLILEACTNRMNSDGSMPTARIMKNWDLLYQEDEVKRPFNPKRFAALRDYLSQERLLAWEEESYLPHQLSHEGKGRAAKWRASVGLMERIQNARKGGEVERASREFGDQVLDQGDGERRERREHLYGDSQDHHLYKPQQEGSIKGNHSSLNRDLTSGSGEEDQFGGNFSLLLRELRPFDYPRPVLRVPSRWSMAA